MGAQRGKGTGPRFTAKRHSILEPRSGVSEGPQHSPRKGLFGVPPLMSPESPFGPRLQLDKEHLWGLEPN